MTVMAGSMEAGNQAWYRSSSWELTSWSLDCRPRETQWHISSTRSHLLNPTKQSTRWVKHSEPVGVALIQTTTSWLLFLCAGVFCLCVGLELELQMTVSWHVGSDTQTQVLCKNSQCSVLLTAESPLQPSVLCGRWGQYVYHILFIPTPRLYF